MEPLLSPNLPHSTKLGNQGGWQTDLEKLEPSKLVISLLYA